MTVEVIVVDPAGQPIAGAEVTIVNAATGLVSSRVTDGSGYTNHVVVGSKGQLCTFTTNGYGFTGSSVAPPEGPAYYYLTPDQVQRVQLTASPFKRPFKPAPRVWAGNMCGVRVAGLPPVDGGAADPSLVLSWFYDRYQPADRQRIRTAWRAKGYTHILLSWPDARAAGATIASFRAICTELITEGFYPAVMLASKDHDPADVDSLLTSLRPVLSALVGTVPIFCIGWELSLWLTPVQVQALTDAIHPIVHAIPNTLLYVHFQEGYPSFQADGGTVADYWHANVGKLNGLLYQKKLAQDDAAFLDSLSDCLQRFCGGWGMPDDSGFGYPFDFVALELTAMTQFNGSTSETEGDRVGRLAINAPACYGPTGTVARVMGSGNGS